MFFLTLEFIVIPEVLGMALKHFRSLTPILAAVHQSKICGRSIKASCVKSYSAATRGEDTETGMCGKHAVS